MSGFCLFFLAKKEETDRSRLHESISYLHVDECYLSIAQTSNSARKAVSYIGSSELWPLVILKFLKSSVADLYYHILYTFAAS